MSALLFQGLPARLGHHQLEGLLRHAAPCSVYHVHPANHDRIPCFVSGYRVCLVEGEEGSGVLLLKPGQEHMKLQLTDAASGVSSTRPCFVPIDSMHRAITTDSSGCAAPHLVRIKIFGVVDEDGLVMRAGSTGAGFPQPGHETFLFPHGLRHFTSENGVSSIPKVGLRISGLCGGRVTVLEPRMNYSAEIRGIPVLCRHSGEPIATAWI